MALSNFKCRRRSYILPPPNSENHGGTVNLSLWREIFALVTLTLMIIIGPTAVFNTFSPSSSSETLADCDKSLFNKSMLTSSFLQPGPKSSNSEEEEEEGAEGLNSDESDDVEADGTPDDGQILGPSDEEESTSELNPSADVSRNVPAVTQDSPNKSAQCCPKMCSFISSKVPISHEGFAFFSAMLGFIIILAFAVWLCVGIYDADRYRSVESDILIGDGQWVSRGMVFLLCFLAFFYWSSLGGSLTGAGCL